MTSTTTTVSIKIARTATGDKVHAAHCLTWADGRTSTYLRCNTAITHRFQILDHEMTAEEAKTITCKKCGG